MQRQYNESLRDIEDKNYQNEMKRNEGVQEIRDKMKEDRRLYEEKLSRRNADWEAKIEKWDNRKKESRDRYVKQLEARNEKRLKR